MSTSSLVFIGVCVILAPHTSKRYAQWFNHISRCYGVFKMNCCNDFGKCTQGFNCPARGKSRSEFTANQLLCKPEAPPNYIPKYDEPPLGRFEDFCEFVSLTWRPVLLGFFCAIALILWVSLGS